MSKADERQFLQVAEAIAGVLREAVQETVTQHSPQPARDRVAELVAVDRRAAPTENGGPAELMATLGLVHWGALAREAVAGQQPDWVEQALDWVGQNLGSRYRARARYTAGALRSEDEAGEIMQYSDALRADFLPSLVWLLAGVVAEHGGGDVDWLRELERGGAGARSR